MSTATTNQQADDIIRNHAWFSTVPGFAPVPLLDLLGITAVQLDMIKQLCRIYEKEYDEQRGKAVVLSLGGAMLSRIPGYAFRSAFKAVPLVGWALGGVSLAAFAAAGTYAVGEVFKEHFDQGGALHDLNPESFRKFYREKWEEGKRMVEKLIERDKEEEV